MIRLALSAAGALALLLSAGCATVPAPADPGLTSDPALAEAAALRSRCGPLRDDRARDCYDQALLAVLAERGVAPAMGVLERLGELDPGVRRDGHLFSHSIGLAALPEPAQVGATFSQCTEIFQSGCYHGVIQAYFARLTEAGDAAGVGAEAVNAVCADYRGRADSRWIFFQCAHGMGHGLTLFHGYHLPMALAGCDLLSDAWERDSCWGGAFMENVVNATSPHHGTGRPQVEAAAGAAPADEHAGHAMAHDHGAMAGEPWKALDRDDPLYPCNALDARYQPSCYLMQTSPILYFNGGDFAAAARACDSAPVVHRAACYQSLGRDASAYSQQDHQRAMRLCANGDPQYRSWCHVGYAKNLVDLTARPADGLDYCRVLDDPAMKSACYAAIGEQTWVLADDPQRRRAWCAEAEPAYRGACMRAAGVTE